MGDEIEGIGERRRRDEPLEWKPWQPPPWIVLQQQLPGPSTAEQGGGEEAVGAVGGSVAPRMARDSYGTPGLDWGVVSGMQAVDVEALGAAMAGDAALVLGEAGVVSALGQVAVAYTRTPVAFSGISEALGAFSDQLAGVSAELMSVPAIGEALVAFGGVAGVVGGAVGFKRELDASQQQGLGVAAGLGIASRAAQFVGGVATALAIVCPPLAPVGVSILAAGAALQLGKLAWESRDDLKAGLKGTGKALQAAADQAAKVVSNGGAQMNAGEPLRLLSDSGASMADKVAARLAGGLSGPKQAFVWLTG